MERFLKKVKEDVRIVIPYWITICDLDALTVTLYTVM